MSAVPDLLTLTGVSKRFPAARGRTVLAVDDVSLTLAAGGALGLVGESGSGKSTLARLAVMLLQPDAGSVEFDGERLDVMSPGELRTIRRRFQYVFQDASGAMNPRMSIAETLSEPLLVHDIRSEGDRPTRIAELLDMVELSPTIGSRFPHELSGGELQRAGLARALAVEPQLLVLDEPVSALDVSIQAQLLSLLTNLRKRLGLAYLTISHDVGVVASVADETAVMYSGRIVERGPTGEVLGRPQHPYTRELIDSIPSTEKRTGRVTKTVEPPDAVPRACAFYGRCGSPAKDSRCESVRPELTTVDACSVACHHPITG